GDIWRPGRPSEAWRLRRSVVVIPALSPCAAFAPSTLASFAALAPSAAVPLPGVAFTRLKQHHDGRRCGRIAAEPLERLAPAVVGRGLREGILIRVGRYHFRRPFFADYFQIMIIHSDAGNTPQFEYLYWYRRCRFPTHLKYDSHDCH